MSSNIVDMHVPCPDCGSSDGMTTYDDGHTYCFVCETHTQGADSSGLNGSRKNRGAKRPLIDVSTLDLAALPARGITAETCKRYGYYKGKVNGVPVHVCAIYDDDRQMVAQKVRTANKEFSVCGKLPERFIGQHLFSGGRILVITEGEIDMLTMSQVQGNKYPVVSLPTGANSAKKVFKAQMEWLSTFESVIVMFDEDEAGRKAVKDISGILSPGRLKVAKLPLKDPNECLLAGKVDELLKSMWDARPYRPDGIINGRDIREEVLEDDTTESYTYPWKVPLQGMTCGIRLGEMVLLTAGTGIGKTTIAREVAYHFGVRLGLKVGMMMLEENKKRTARGLMSVHAETRMHVNWKSIPAATKAAAFDATLGTGNFTIYDHFGSIEGDNLLSKMRFMITGEGCQFIILDHISIAVSGLEDTGNSNERRIIDKLMTQLRSLIEETGAGILVISHLRKMDGDSKSHEEGGAISLDHLRGSGTLKQIPDTIVAGERNQQSDDDDKNIIRLRLLKCRWTGETGIAGYLHYNKDTDRLLAVDRVSDYQNKDRTVDLSEDAESPF